MNVSDTGYYLSKGFLYLEKHRAEPQTLIASSEDSLQHIEKTKDRVGLRKSLGTTGHMRKLVPISSKMKQYTYLELDFVFPKLTELLEHRLSRCFFTIIIFGYVFSFMGQSG